MSNIHNLIITSLKVKADKLPPKFIKYRDYKIFDNEAFNNRPQIF